jgi:FAD binding domain-containing protein
MNTPSTAAPRTTQTLKAAIAGQVFVRGEAGYDQGRRAWNLAMDQRPAVIVEAESAADVAQAVRYARAHGMRIAPQGTGHGAEPLEPLDGAMLLRTTRMRQVRIDPATRTARAQAGAVWEDVTVPAGQHGLAALAGSSPDVGVTGYTLGGGLGWLARRYGLAANSVTAAELVTPGGDLVRADAGHEPDLFWAVRGGGGVGVVTALEMRLYSVRELYAGDLFFPIARAAEVLHAWREWTDTVPDEVTSLAHLLRLPPLPELPEPLRGRAFVMVEAACLGDANVGAELTGPLRRLGPELDTFAMILAPALGQLNMDPPQPVPSQGDGAFLGSLPAAAVDALVAVAGPDAQTPPDSVEVRHLGGALARPVPGGGAQPSIDASYLLFAAAAAPAPGLAGPARAYAQTVKDALAPWHASYDYYNFAETPAPAGAVLPPASYRRLQQIKAAHDPDQLIISAHPAWPTRP